MKLHFKTIVLVLGLIFVVGCETTVVDENAKIPPPPVTAQVYRLGDEIVFENGLIINPISTRANEGSGFSLAEEGYEYFYIKVQITNHTQETVAISSIIQFELKDDDGYKYELSLFADIQGQLDGSILSSDKMTGEVAFEIPTEFNGNLYLYFKPDLFSDPIKIKVKG